MHDYLVNTKGLSNLIWVWSVQDLSTNFTDYDPGSNYWDVFTLDVYDASGYTSAKYNQMLSIAGTKPIAIGECATLPSSSLLASQPRWTFFMGWRELTQQQNSTSAISSVYNASNVLTRDELPGWNSATPTRTATFTGTNLALNRPATASSTESATYPASAAVDGNSTTRWGSAFSDPQWIYVDLGASYNVNRVRLNWEAAYANAYQVQVSNDASSWTTIYSRTSGPGGLNDLTVSGMGRYVRMYGTTRATAYGYSLFDFEVYGTAAGGPTPTRTPTPTAVPGGISASAWYSLAAKHSNKCVDARASGAANGTVVQQYTCNNGYAQQFQFQLISGSTYRLGNRNSSSQVLDVAGQSTADGGLAQLWASNGQTNQQWTAVSEGNGYYHFVNVGSGKCLDVPGGSTADSVQMQQWACNGNPQQSFLLQAH